MCIPRIFAAAESGEEVGDMEDVREGEGEEDQEEEAWLDALEAGRVNERGYLPEKRDSASLTARQVNALLKIHLTSNLLANFKFSKQLSNLRIYYVAPILRHHQKLAVCSVRKVYLMACCIITTSGVTSCFTSWL